jgi:hypothetical protein
VGGALEQKINAAALSSSGSKAALAPLRTWLVACGCACHDAHNALRWGMSQGFGDKELLKELVVGVEALRNGYSTLHEYLAGWLSQRVRFVAAPCAPPELLAKLWVTLGVAAEEAEDLGRLGLMWRAGGLEVVAEREPTPELFGELSGHLLGLWLFTKFTDSRWVTVGKSCRTLLVAQLTGVGDLVDFALGQPGVSAYYLGGFQRMRQNPQTLSFLSTAALACYLPNSILMSLLAEDGIGRRLPELKEVMAEELEFVLSLPGYQWDILAETCGRIGEGLRATVLEAAHVAAAFLHTQIFREAERGVWGLLQGDTD